jgi:hypothetical protein
VELFGQDSFRNRDSRELDRGHGVRRVRSNTETSATIVGVLAIGDQEQRFSHLAVQPLYAPSLKHLLVHWFIQKGIEWSWMDELFGARIPNSICLQLDWLVGDRRVGAEEMLIHAVDHFSRDAELSDRMSDRIAELKARAQEVKFEVAEVESLQNRVVARGIVVCSVAGMVRHDVLARKVRQQTGFKTVILKGVNEFRLYRPGYDIARVEEGALFQTTVLGLLVEGGLDPLVIERVLGLYNANIAWHSGVGCGLDWLVRVRLGDELEQLKSHVRDWLRLIVGNELPLEWR